ncbi:MAG: hypothetical protein K2Y40_17675 [Reyranella sp.]|nr:hypothetical protein [Reyranella sp.]
MPTQFFRDTPASVPVLCFVLIAILTLAFTCVSIVVRPAMYSDSGWGFYGWDAGQRTPAFNTSQPPDPADISKDVTRFMTTWTPGQHVLPGLLEQLGLSLGLAMALVTALFSILGLAGWFALYRRFGFPLRTTMVALALITCSRSFNLSFSIYTGGEVLLFGVAPWFILLAWTLRDLRWCAILPLLAGAFLLFFAKLSGIILAAATICGAAACGDEAWRRRDTIRKLGVAAVTIVTMALAFYYGWYVRGPTAASIAADVHPHGLAFYMTFAISSLWGASLSLGDLGSYLFLNPRRPVLTSVDAIYYALLPAALLFLVLPCWQLRRSHGEYLRFTTIIAAATTVVIVGILVRGGSVSLEERHFRVVSQLLLVGVVHTFLEVPGRSLRLLFLAVATVASLYGVASFAVRTEANLHHPLGIRGFRQSGTTAEVLEFIRKIDAVTPGAEAPLVLVPSPEIGLEFRHARVLSNHADFEPIDELRRQVYRGRVDRLYVLVQKRLLSDGKADAILRSFVDYPMDGWKMVPLGDFVCFYQVRPG